MTRKRWISVRLPEELYQELMSQGPNLTEAIVARLEVREPIQIEGGGGGHGVGSGPSGDTPPSFLGECRHLEVRRTMGAVICSDCGKRLR